MPAQAEILARDDRGFVVREVVEVGAPAPEVWRTLVKPAAWWSSEHTFSGEAANLTLDPVPGGCFCEKLPPAKQGGAAAVSGGVQHMRVVYVEPGRALRLTGALGPLQSEALLGAMTITLKTNERGTRILIEYVVGGYMRYRVEQIAPAVDRMLGQQIARLADKLGGALPAEGTGVPGAGEGGATAAPTGPDDGDSVKPAPALRNAPQGLRSRPMARRSPAGPWARCGGCRPCRAPAPRRRWWRMTMAWTCRTTPRHRPRRSRGRLRPSQPSSRQLASRRLTSVNRPSRP
ncbi:SRPBCC family protein [Novosphingobium pokkalii]|uniref:SRPBCC family protein n=1 Tax=Novosphingobium pokkalii TaxID=1770194 RepID=UPI0036413309